MDLSPAGLDMASVKLRYTIRDRDRHGNMRIYFRRRKGERKIRLHGEEGSDDFLTAYKAALAGKAQNPADCPTDDRAKVEKPVPGSFRAVSLAYFTECAEFLQNDPETQRVTRRVFESMWVEPFEPGSPLTFGQCPLTEMTGRHVKILRDRKLAYPHAANRRLKNLRPFFHYAFEEELIANDPSASVGNLEVPSGGHHSWSVAEVRQYEERHPVGSKARQALALFAFTGLRISDVASLGRQHERAASVKGVRVESFQLRLFKGRRRKPVDLVIPILPELRQVLDASPRGDLTYLVNAYGVPYSVKGLGQRMRKWCDAAGLPHCSAHGIRKAGAALAAENGATEHQLMALFGWTTSQQATLYTRAARQRKIAAGAMHLMLPGADDGPDEEQTGPTFEGAGETVGTMEGIRK